MNDFFRIHHKPALLRSPFSIAVAWFSAQSVCSHGSQPSSQAAGQACRAATQSNQPKFREIGTCQHVAIFYIQYELQKICLNFAGVRCSIPETSISPEVLSFFGEIQLSKAFVQDLVRRNMNGFIGPINTSHFVYVSVFSV